MTTTTEIRNAIVARLMLIENIGKVHSFERFAVQASAFKALYTYNDRIHGWRVSRSGFKKTMIADGIYSMRATWELMGYLSLDDADKTELTFDELVDAVQLKIANDPMFGGLTTWIEEFEIKATFEPVMFHGVLCHSVKLTFDTEHEEMVSIDTPLDDFNLFVAQYDIEPHEAVAEYTKWLADPANYSTSKPVLVDEVQIQN